MATIGISAKESLGWMLKSLFFSALPLMVWEVFCHFRAVSIQINILVVIMIFCLHYYRAFRNDPLLNLSFKKMKLNFNFSKK
jgi:hypothetical protein